MPKGIPKSGINKGWFEKGSAGFVGKHTPEAKLKMRTVKLLNPVNYKGDKAGYKARHQWVVSRLGKPDICESCGKSGLKGIEIHWANKSDLYLRDINDWIRLCAKCHKVYDRQNGGMKINLSFNS